MAVTVDSKLLAPARVTRAQAERFLIPKPNGEYTDADVRHILSQYFTVGPAVGLDPLLAVAQMELETAFLASFWAANSASDEPTRVPGTGTERITCAGTSCSKRYTCRPRMRSAPANRAGWACRVVASQRS